MIWALALAGGLLTLALLAKPAQAQDKGAISEHFPVAFTLDASPCAGELIDVTGTLHTVNHFRARPDGTSHSNIQFNLAGVKGVGLDPDTEEPNGNQYVIPSSGAAVENVVQSGQIITGTVDINLIIGKGQLPNQVAFSRVHYVIDENGEIKVTTVQGHFKCQPGNTSPSATASATATANAAAKTNATVKASPTAKASPNATASHGTGSAPLAMGAGLLLVGAGLAVRRLF